MVLKTNIERKSRFAPSRARTAVRLFSWTVPFPEAHITNLSDFHITDSMASLLSKGLGDAVSQKKNKKKNTINRPNKSGLPKIRKPKNKIFFFSEIHQTHNHIHIPPQGIQALENYLETTRQTVLTSITWENHYQTNLSAKEFQAIRILQNNPDIIINKKADKGNGIVIENTSDYITNGLQHLSNPDSFQQLPADSTQCIATATHIITTWSRIYQRYYKRISNLTRVSKPLKNLFYIKKLHKNPHGIRPIISGVNGILLKTYSPKHSFNTEQ